MQDRPAVPPPPFVHVLQTRFNMPTPGREATFRNRPDWLSARFELFETWCLPSVQAQTLRSGADFTWIIYFDRNTPPEFRSRIDALREKVAFEPYYTGMFPASGWPISLRETLGALPPFVLTSRLDNDDALAVDYMERTATAAREVLRSGRARAVPRSGIVITNGFIRTMDKLYSFSHPCNAFTSWLERSDSDETLKTALGISHMAASEEGQLVQVPGAAGWLQIVHGGNVSNKVRGWRVAPGALDGCFPPYARQGLRPTGTVERLMENTLVTPLRTARDHLSTGWHRLRRRLAPPPG